MSFSPIPSASVDDLNNTISHCEDVLQKNAAKKNQKEKQKDEPAEKYASLQRRFKAVQQLKTRADKDLEQVKRELAELRVERDEGRENEKDLAKRNGELENATSQAVKGLKTVEKKYVALQERARGLEQAAQRNEGICHMLRGQLNSMAEAHEQALASKEAETKLLLGRYKKNEHLLKVVESTKQIDKVYLPKIHRDFYDAHGGVVPPNLHHAGAMVDVFHHRYYDEMHTVEKELAQARMVQLLNECHLDPHSADVTYRNATKKIHAMRNDHAHPTSSGRPQLNEAGIKAYEEMLENLGILTEEEQKVMVGLFTKICEEETQANKRTTRPSPLVSLPWSTSAPWSTSTPLTSRPSRPRF